MKTLWTLLILVASTSFADVPTKELLSSERIVNHAYSFSRFDVILKSYGFKRAKVSAIQDLTAHIDLFVEWVYYTQHVFSDSKNEILVGYDDKGTMDTRTVRALAPLCDCPEYQAHLRKRAQMDEAIERLKQDSSNANQLVESTGTNSATQ